MALPGYGSRDSDTAKKNYDAIEYGNRHGAISFGKINQKANTTNAVLLETPDAKHCMYMIEDGDEKGNSTFLTPAVVFLNIIDKIKINQYYLIVIILLKTPPSCTFNLKSRRLTKQVLVA